MFRRTISREVLCKGNCPFHGGISTVCFCPAECGSGIRFIRDDLKKSLKENSIIIANKNAHFDCSQLNTTISNGYCEVFMVEHILSSLWAFRISDIDIHIDCSEIPMLDGSAKYWVAALESAGEKNFDVSIKHKTINKVFKYEDNDSYIIARPCDRLKISYTIDFQEKSIGKNTFVYDETINSYKKDISLARTFCTKQQVSKHISIKNYFNNYDMLIYDDDGTVFTGEHSLPRYSNEPTRHKILDLIGDLMSTGDFFYGEFFCYKSGHSMNRKLIDLIYTSN